MEQARSPKSYVFHKICFFLLGFCGAIPWFTILSTLDFFVSKYPAYNVPQSIIIPNFVGQGIFAFLIYFLSFYITLNVRIKYSLISLIIILLILINIPLVTSEEALYWGVLFFVFCLGSACTVFQTSSTALCYVFPLEFPPLFFLGNSSAGMFTVGMRMILMKILENNDNPLTASTIGFALVANILLIITIILYEKLKTTQLYFNCLYRDYKQSLAQSILGSHLNDFNSFKQTRMDEHLKMEKYKSLLNSVFTEIVNEEEREDEEEKEDISIIDPKLTFGPDNNYEMTKSYDAPVSYKNFSYKSIEIQNIKKSAFTIKASADTNVKKNKNKLEWRYFYPILRKISPMMIFILIIFAQTLFVFPGIVIQKKLFANYLNESWNSLLWILIFNTSDTLARVFTLWPLKLKLKTVGFLVLVRFVFWGSFILIKHSEEGEFLKNDWFCIFHLIIFSIYGGVLTNTLMIMALEGSSSNEKETIGLLISIPTIYGMMFGSIIALASKFL